MVYLEVADDGRSMAHVAELPGCIVRAGTREEALRELPAAIEAYQVWLRRHGEPARPAGGPIEIEVAEERTQGGPFDPGDAAALFPPDLGPLMSEEMEQFFRLMRYNRADLLALVGDPSDELLDWKPFPGAYNLRRVLRHVGNGEEWYVSRIVPVETLPPEWEDDAHLPHFVFLEMSRRTAIERLRLLTDEERVGVFYPTYATQHPEEPWTARKVLRRFLEHEREHTAQVREILAARRRWLVARLAAERAGLLAALWALDERLLTGVSVVGDWTVKDLLVHIAGWDRWEERTMRSMVAGEVVDLAATEDFDGTNAAWVAAGREHSLEAVLVELGAARADLLAWSENLPEEVFFEPRSYEGDDWSFPSVLQIQWEHDIEHTEQIAAWRKAIDLQGNFGTRAVTVAALEAARGHLLAAADLVPAEARDSWPVCGEWTTKDVLGHIADWELFGVEGLRMMAAGQAPLVEPLEDIDQWNRVHAQARQEQSWEAVWDDLHRSRQAMMEVLGEMSEGQLTRTFPFPWGAEGTAYDWLGVYMGHDREHAREMSL
jgi:predicted RNase H-like HicB family nuclease/uncharacterized damage-inducible protein DinB